MFIFILGESATAFSEKFYESVLIRVHFIHCASLKFVDTQNKITFYEGKEIYSLEILVIISIPSPFRAIKTCLLPW